MKETYYAGAYWLARKEDADACAQRAETFLHLLAACEPGLTHWFDPEQELEEQSTQKSKTQLLRMFLQEEPSSTLGYSLTLWDGKTDEGSSNIRLSCGYTSRWVSNACVLSLPKEGPASERLLQAPVLARILRAMALAWEPECGVALSHEHLDKVSETAAAGTFLGWVSYFSHRRGPVPPLPPPVQVEPVEDKGTLIILTPERFTASNPAHLELALRTTETLSQAGLLGPLSPWDS
jgi:hypothetical protein